MNRNPHNLPEEITAHSADDIIKMAYPDLFSVITRYDLAINFAKLDGRKVKDGLRHFAREFGKEAKHVALKQLLNEMQRSVFPESYRPQLVAILDKARKIAHQQLGVRK